MSVSFILLVVAFVIGYAVIALEHPLKVNKTATAVLLCAVMWTIVAIGGTDAMVSDVILKITAGVSDTLGVNDELARDFITTHILSHLGETGEIVFFLLGAMTIVEIVDRWGGFRVITDHIQAASKVKLMWILGVLAFFMSAVLDNLTTTIVMLALLNKIVPDKHTRWFFASMLVLCANAGGAWSPIGDVTTIMLWIGGKVSAGNIMLTTLPASIVSVVVPLVLLSFFMKGNIEKPDTSIEDNSPASKVSESDRLFMLVSGVCLLLAVPIFKSVTHLPPYIGMLGALGIIWMIAELKRPADVHNTNHYDLDPVNIIRRVDVPSVLFFLGILMAVGALQVCGHLSLLANSLDQISLAEPTKYFVINGIIGVLSSIVDNVPLVAASMGMYDFPVDHYFWEMLAYCAGTGGSILIIGSAAGVAAMGIEKIDFIWYIKHVSGLALIGYVAGALTYVAQYMLLH